MLVAPNSVKDWAADAEDKAEKTRKSRRTKCGTTKNLTSPEALGQLQY